MREEDNRKILIPFLYDFGDGIDLSFGELVAKPFSDDQQVHPSLPSDEALPLLQFQRLAYLQHISTGEITIGELCLYIIEYDMNSKFKVERRTSSWLSLRRRLLMNFSFQRRRALKCLMNFYLQSLFHFCLSQIDCTVSAKLKL